MNRKFFHFVLSALCASGVRAQTLTVAVGKASAVAGGGAMIPVTLANAPTNLSTFCFFLTNAPGFGLPAVAAGPAQINLVTFVDDFSNGVFRVTGLVTNEPPIGNGVVANLIYSVPAGATPGTYPLVLPAAPPADGPAGPNPEARSLVTSSLITSAGANGFILIATVTPPYLTSLTGLGDGAFQFAFTNTDGASFSVSATTNLALPITSWTLIGTATQISPGLYQFTDPAAANYSRRFYLVHSP